MTVRELIKELADYNPDARVDVVVHNMTEEFSLTYGDSDGVTKKSAEVVSFYVDTLCDNENEGESHESENPQ